VPQVAFYRSSAANFLACFFIYDFQSASRTSVIQVSSSHLAQHVVGHIVSYIYVIRSRIGRHPFPS
jgi:hypothetical protein